MANFLIIRKVNSSKNIEILNSISDFEFQYFTSDCAILLSGFTKFPKDCVFSENCKSSALHIMLAGVILNDKQLKQKYRTESMEHVVENSYMENGDSCHQEFEGSFFGSIFDHEKGELIVFSDSLSNYPIYYFINDEWLVISNQICLVLSELKRLRVKLCLDEVGVYSQLTYAYYLGNHTLIEDVKRIIPGNYLVVNNLGIEQKIGYKLPKQSYKGSNDEAIEMIDKLFLEAVNLQIEKNKQYGYMNLTALSAGLDSRMCVYALKRLNAENVVCYTYSESGQLDHLIPQDIAHELGYRWIFKSLDGGNDLKEIDEAIKISDMRCYYPWASQLNDFLKFISQKEMGLVITGVIGDVVIGTFCHEYYQNDALYSIGDGAYSNILINKLKSKLNGEEVSVGYETGMFYNRAFNGACIGYSTTFQKYTEALSPFMYKPLFEFCCSIPSSRRYQHELYFSWIRKYYPEVMKHSWNGLSIPRHNGYIKIRDKKVYLDTIPSRMKGIILSKTKKNLGMNPMDFWYENNVHLKTKMDNYYEQHLYLLDAYPELQKDVIDLYTKYNTIEKTMCISVLGYIEEFLS